MSDQSTGSDLEQSKHRDARRRTTAVVAAVALLVGMLLITVGVAANSSAGCSACHASQSDALAASAHSDTECTVCHAAAPGQVAARVDVVARMVPSSVGGLELDGPGRPIGSGPCLTCHQDVLSGEVLLKNGLRIDHLACTSQTSCSACHSQASHGTSTRVVRAASMSECIACHLEQSVSVACETCHEGKWPPIAPATLCGSGPTAPIGRAHTALETFAPARCATPPATARAATVAACRTPRTSGRHTAITP